ncbi:MAG: hypothetical protein ACOVOR_02720 [Rhabdochlamydiaceae bacterium]
MNIIDDFINKEEILKDSLSPFLGASDGYQMFKTNLKISLLLSCLFLMITEYKGIGLSLKTVQGFGASLILQKRLFKLMSVNLSCCLFGLFSINSMIRSVILAVQSLNEENSLQKTYFQQLRSTTIQEVVKQSIYLLGCSLIFHRMSGSVFNFSFFTVNTSVWHKTFFSIALLGGLGFDLEEKWLFIRENFKDWLKSDWEKIGVRCAALGYSRLLDRVISKNGLTRSLYLASVLGKAEDAYRLRKLYLGDETILKGQIEYDLFLHHPSLFEKFNTLICFSKPTGVIQRQGVDLLNTIKFYLTDHQIHVLKEESRTIGNREAIQVLENC